MAVPAPRNSPRLARVKAARDLSSPAAEVLSRLAVEHKASQIFIGRRGLSKLQALLFGSTAGSLVQISPVPVTVIP